MMSEHEIPHISKAHAETIVNSSINDGNITKDDLYRLQSYIKRQPESTSLESTTDSDDMIRAQFVAAAIPEAWGCPKFAVEANDVGDAVMAEFAKRREARNGS